MSYFVDNTSRKLNDNFQISKEQLEIFESFYNREERCEDCILHAQCDFLSGSATGNLCDVILDILENSES